MSDNTNPPTPQQANQAAAQNAVPSISHDAIRNFIPPDNCLDGKTILVTGAGDGIGRVAALS